MLREIFEDYIRTTGKRDGRTGRSGMQQIGIVKGQHLAIPVHYEWLLLNEARRARKQRRSEDARRVITGSSVSSFSLSPSLVDPPSPVTAVLFYDFACKVLVAAVSQKYVHACVLYVANKKGKQFHVIARVV